MRPRSELLALAQETILRISADDVDGDASAVDAAVVIGLLELLFPNDEKRWGRAVALLLAADDGRGGTVAPDGRQRLRAWTPDADAPLGFRELTGEEIDAVT